MKYKDLELQDYSINEQSEMDKAIVRRMLTGTDDLVEVLDE